jgi:hypothetical protein
VASSNGDGAEATLGSAPLHIRQPSACTKPVHPEPVDRIPVGSSTRGTTRCAGTPPARAGSPDPRRVGGEVRRPAGRRAARHPGTDDPLRADRRVPGGHRVRNCASTSAPAGRGCPGGPLRPIRKLAHPAHVAAATGDAGARPTGEARGVRVASARRDASGPAPSQPAPPCRWGDDDTALGSGSPASERGDPALRAQPGCRRGQSARSRTGRSVAPMARLPAASTPTARTR